jgi:hypothetical protein
MSKHIILESYSFSPGSGGSNGVVTVNNKWIRREQLLLITNVTANVIIYNFSDSSKGAVSYSLSNTNNVESTVITLNYNTNSMNSTDKLAILVEETYQETVPAETFMDPVGKNRVSTPQALIDTDFEYGVQSTKWETLALMNNRPSAFYDATQGISSTTTSVTVGGNTAAYQITSVTASGRTVTININNTTNISTTTPIYVQDTTDPNANGWFMPSSVSSNTNIVYIAKNNISATNIFDYTKTYLFVGSFFTGAGIAVSTTGGAAFANTGTAVTCTTKDAHGLTIGQAIFVVGTTASTNAPNGAWYVRQTPTSNTFIFDVTAAPTGTISVPAGGSGLTVNTTIISGGLNAIAINVAGSGYTQGDIVSVAGGTGGLVKIVSAPGGVPYVIAVAAVGSGYTNATGAGTTYAYSVNCLYPRTWGTSIHRAYDGGVTFTAGYPYHGNQLIRQTRRAFRYQSGKGIQFSTGSNMCSPWQTDNITSVGTTVTVTFKFPHNAGVGAIITVSGCDQSAYNGNWTITSIPSDISLTYTISNSAVSPATSAPGFTVQPYQWYGASIQIGMFTLQNGFFFRYDGQTLFTVERNSTNQLSGYITQLEQGSQTVLGTNTRWSQQLQVGSYIVIRGMSYVVISIQSDTAITIYPDYRGTPILTPSQVVVSVTTDIVYPQSSWNIDRGDGTGISGMNIDIRKMQMWYMDYSWYGAGAIRWGFKNARGEVQYVHRSAHGNARTEAYMRSGNMPARYEVNTFYPKTQLSSTLNASDTTVNVLTTTGFPTSGNLIITGSGNTGAIIEYISYSGKTSSSFTGAARGVQTLTGPGGLANGGGSVATTFSYSATAPVSIAFWGPQSANTISHWGSSVVMDGRYDDDKSLIFVAGMTNTISNIAANTTQPLISIRIAPSVDSGLTGTIGQREILNTMQLIMRQCDVYTTGTAMTFLITLRLNGIVANPTPIIATGTLASVGYMIVTAGTTSFTSIGAVNNNPGTVFIATGAGTGTGTVVPCFVGAGGSSLSQVCYHTAGQTISGGETMFGFFTTTPGVTSGDLTGVRELGNSVIAGGNSFNVPFSAANKYPDGPDMVTICATNVTAVTTNTINARLSWTEAQA